MSFQADVATRNAMLDAIEAAIGTDPDMEWFDGTMPANCAAADAGTKIGKADLPSDWMAAASGGTKAKSGTWTENAADAAGAIKYARVKSSGGACKMQFLCSDAWVPSKAYLAGRHVHNGGNVYRCTTGGTSASSGGPSGTGTGITDGGAVWEFVQAGTDMTLVSCDIGIGQEITVSSFTLTAGNP